MGMTTKGLGPFLSASRAARSPEAANVRWSGVRRVPGLRREEVAMLAGVSVDYYARLEQGRELHPSASVLDAICRALNLDHDAREHLFRLADVAPGTGPVPVREQVELSLLSLMDAWSETPAFLINRRLDILARNPLAAALYRGFANADNLARMTLLDPAGPAFFSDWHRSAEACVANLRLALGYDSTDNATLRLVDELSAGSTQFDSLWARHNVRGKTNEAKTFLHPEVGSLTLEYISFDVRSASGQQLIVYRAEPCSSSDTALRLLGTLAATERLSRTADEEQKVQR